MKKGWLLSPGESNEEQLVGYSNISLLWTSKPMKVIGNYASRETWIIKTSYSTLDFLWLSPHLNYNSQFSGLKLVSVTLITLASNDGWSREVNDSKKATWSMLQFLS